MSRDDMVIAITFWVGLLLGAIIATVAFVLSLPEGGC